MGNELFTTIVKQLGFFGDGSFAKFDEIFKRATEYCGLPDISSNGFARYIYYDFLVTAGIIEPQVKNGLERWTFLSDQFLLRRNEGTYILDVDFEKNDACSTVDVVSSNLDIFPKANISTSDQEQSDFYDQFSTFKLNWKELKRSAYRKMESPDLENKTVEIFKFEQREWVELDEVQLTNGLYRVMGRPHESYFMLVKGNERNRIIMRNWIFLLACQELSLPWTSLFFPDGEDLICPWKVKTPSIMKRCLMSLSESIGYEKIGIRYRVKDKEKLNKVLSSFFKD